MKRHTPPSRYSREPLRPAYVYRCYDADGVLLYVGCSSNPTKRVEDHRANAWWGQRIATVRNTVFPYNEYALDMEREAIWTERPICNVKGRWYVSDAREDWTIEEYRLLRHAVVMTARGVIGTSTTRLLNRIDSEVKARFGVTLLGGAA